MDKDGNDKLSLEEVTGYFVSIMLESADEIQERKKQKDTAEFEQFKAMMSVSTDIVRARMLTAGLPWPQAVQCPFMS